MPIYSYPSGEGTDTVWLEHWSIRELNGVRRFVGYSRATRAGRMSTEIVELDAEARIGRTASGHIYVLVGPKGYSSHGEYVFHRVVESIGPDASWCDVTDHLIPDCRVDMLTGEAAAELLHVSRTYLNKLVDDGLLPRSRTSAEGHRRIPRSVLLAFKQRMRAAQNDGLDLMIVASERMGLYDAEFKGVPEPRSK